MTKKLYEQDAYCKVFSAVVKACEEMDGKFGIILDQTAFFPEGGGQVADVGTIQGIPVLDVQKQGTKIFHMIETELQIGETVDCEINWDLRYRRMQSHTGEHILSGVIHSLYGYDNVGFHMGEERMVVDVNGSLSPEDIVKIEQKANEAVYENADVIASYPTLEELEKIPFRSKKELNEALRIISIGTDIDCCACCAPHVSKTGEIGVIKVLDFYSYKQGTRIEMVAGKDALLEYIRLNQTIKELMKLVSAPRNKVVDSVRERNNTLQELRYEYQNLSKRLALQELELQNMDDFAYGITENITFDELRYCINRLLEQQQETCFLFSKNEDGYSYVVSSNSKDIRGVVKQLNDTFSGKGGGKSNYAQGKLANASREELETFMETVVLKCET